MTPWIESQGQLPLPNASSQSSAGWGELCLSQNSPMSYSTPQQAAPSHVLQFQPEGELEEPEVPQKY